MHALLFLCYFSGPGFKDYVLKIICIKISMRLVSKKLIQTPLDKKLFNHCSLSNMALAFNS
jgi:hypothetical protein